MGVYRRMLLVVDLTEDSLPIGRKAQALAQALGAEVELLHVVEFVPVEPMGETLMPAVQIEEASRRSPLTSGSPGRPAGSKAATSRRRSCAWHASATPI